MQTATSECFAMVMDDTQDHPCLEYSLFMVYLNSPLKADS